MSNNRPIVNALSMARGAGKLVMGFDAVKDSIKSKNAVVVLTACDISEKTVKEIEFTANKENVKCVSLPVKMEELIKITKRAVGVFALTDEGFEIMLRSALNKYEADRKEISN